MSFICECCQHEDDFCSWTRARWQEPTVWVCPYCRAVYSVKRGDYSLIRAAATPVGTGRNILGPWQDRKHWPIHAGAYHVRLTDSNSKTINENWVTLRYDGITFVNDDGDPVPATQYISWRGNWPD